MASSARIDELQKKFNENPRRYFAPLADEYRKAGDLPMAIDLCRTHLAQQPGHMSGHIVLGKALYENGELDDARATFETALGLDPENLIALRHLGDIARRQGDAPSARAWYQRVLDADPRNDEMAEQIAALETAEARADEPAASVDPALPPALAEAPDTLAESTVPDGSLPPALEPAAIAYLAEETTADAPAAERETADTIDLDLSALDTAAPAAAATPVVAERAPTAGEFGDIDALADAPEAPAAAPVAPAPASNELGLESMEFVPPSGDDRATQAEGLERPDYNFEPHVVDGSMQGDATPAAFVTETMAELYLQQGFRDEALQVYRQLLEANPADENLRARVQQLETGGRSTLAFEVSEDVVRAAQERHAKATRRTVRHFFASLAARRAPLREGGIGEHGAPMDADHADAMPAGGYAYGPTGVDTSAMDAEAFVAPHSDADQERAHAFETREFEAPAADAHHDEYAGGEAHHHDAQGYDISTYETSAYETQGYETQGYESQGYDAGDQAATPADGDAYAASTDSWGGIDQESESRTGGEFDVAAYETSAWESAPSPSPDSAAPAATPSRGMTPSGGQGGVTGTVDALFGGAPASADDEAAAERLAGVFTGTPAALPAVRPAKSELSLDQVFRETPRRSESQRRESSAFSFDQFFSEPQAAPGPAAPAPAPPPAPGQGGDNDEQFNAWLEGLKQK